MFYAYLGLILWLPVPWGSNVAWAWSLMAVWLFILSAFWIIQYFRNRVTLTESFMRAWPVVVCLGVIVLWVELQALALSPDLLGILSPHALDIHSSAQSHTSLSLDVHATRSGGLKTLSYFLLFCLTLLLVNSGHRVRVLASVIVISGLLQAGYGAYIALTQSGLATGTFINRNHLAGYLSMCLAMGTGLILAELSAHRPSGWRDRIRGILTTLLSNKAWIRLALVVMVIALVLTRSRGGNLGFFISLTVVGGVYLLYMRRVTRGSIIFFVSLLVIDIIVVGNFFGIEQVAERLQQTTMEDGARGDLVRDSINIVRNFPLTGTGAGSFYSVYPMYNSGITTSHLFKHAENDYLQFASEFGLPAYALLGFSVAASLWVAVKAMLKRRNRIMLGVGFGVTMGIIAMLVQAMVGFNLQIPANAALFVVILALAWAALHCDRNQTSSRISSL